MERFFDEITSNRVRSGNFRSVDALIEVIMDDIAACNENPKPLIWTKSAEAILAKVTRAKTALDNSPSA